jgi:hypothetical protein
MIYGLQEPSTCRIEVCIEVQQGEGEGGGIPVSSSLLAPRHLARKDLIEDHQQFVVTLKAIVSHPVLRTKPDIHHM